MKWLLVALLVIALAVVVVVVVRRLTTTSQDPTHDDFIGDQSKVQVDQLKQLRNGDVIEHLAHRWFVRGQIDLIEGGYRWSEFLLDDAEAKRWLSVEDDESFEVALWRAIALGDIEQGSAGDRDVIVGGVAYRLQERGSARFNAVGSTGTGSEGQVEYADYESVDGRLLGFEKWGTSWEPALGEKLQPWELTVYPSTDRPAQL